MVLESAQLLSTAHRILDGSLRDKIWVHANSTMNATLYKATHVNHPSAIWVRASHENYLYLLELFKALCNEYTHRYKKIHAVTKLIPFLSTPPSKIPRLPFSEPPQCMPEQYVSSTSTIEGYRSYYIHDKARFAKYTNRNAPAWMIPALEKVFNLTGKPFEVIR